MTDAGRSKQAAAADRRQNIVAAGTATATAETASTASSSFVGVTVGAVIVLCFACALGGVRFFASHNTKVALERFAMQAWSGDLSWSDLTSTAGTKELSKREALQQGRVPKGKGNARRCVDSWLGCNDATAEMCAAAESMRERCCRTCHQLTCFDNHPSCYEWAMDDQCLDNPQ